MRELITHTVSVKVYSTKEAMRRAIRRFGYECTHTEAMVIPCQVYDCKNKNGTECVKVPISAELYIHRNASLPVLVHETLHASTSAIRDKRRSLNLGVHINSREERLAYYQTAILQDILKTFFPKKNSGYDFKDIEWWVRGSVKSNRQKK